MTASATATSRNPIARLELWLNGEKYQEQIPQGNLNTFYVSFEIEMTEGSHMLFFRVIDNEGLVGQSLPIPITGTPALAVVVTEGDGHTLDEIAQALGAPPDEIQGLNPELGNGGLPGGTEVTVPKPPAKANDTEPKQGQDGNEADNQNGTKPDGTGADGSQNDSQSDNKPKPYEVGKVVFPSFPIGDLLSALAAVRPKAPTSFHAEYKDCVVELHWYDNAKNETHFNIWMQREYGPPQLIDTTSENPRNGPTSYKFKAPRYGFYNFWVEAGNSLGAQPSEIMQVFVSNQTCETGIATELEIEALDMYIFETYEEFYCYLSIEEGEYRRIPESVMETIHVNNHWGDITKHWGGQKRILYPMPADEELKLEGTCLADLGPFQLSPFTNFNTSVPRDKWDGSRQEIKTDFFLIGYRVRPSGPETASGAFQYVDYSLNPPDIYSVEAEGELQIPEKDWKARTVTLKWGLEGDQNQINNFLILIDGEEFRYVDKRQRQESILMGSACGQEYSFEMVAIGPGGARSAPSTRRVYTQPPCPVMAEVHFQTVYSSKADDSDCFTFPIPFPIMSECYPYYGCGTLDGVTYEIWAQGAGNKRTTLKYGTDQYQFTYWGCVEMQFSNQLGADQDKIIVPIDPSNPEIRFGTTFWEHDGGPNDTFGKTDEPRRYDYDTWPTVDEIVTLTAPFSDDTADATIKVHVRGFAYAGGSFDLYVP